VIDRSHGPAQQVRSSSVAAELRSIFFFRVKVAITYSYCSGLLLLITTHQTDQMDKKTNKRFELDDWPLFGLLPRATYADAEL
jgi:hypothetical protein